MSRQGSRAGAAADSKKNRRGADAPQLLEHASARSPALDGRKPANDETVGRKPANVSAVSAAEAPGTACTGDTLRDRLAHQLEAGVGDQRRSGIADQRDARALSQLGAAGGAARARHCGRYRRSAALQMPWIASSLARHPCVLRGDEVAGLQHIQRPQGDVAGIADGRGDDIKPGRQALRIAAGRIRFIQPCRSLRGLPFR